MVKHLTRAVAISALLVSLTLWGLAACDNTAVSSDALREAAPAAGKAATSDTSALVQKDYTGLIMLHRTRIGPTYALHIGLDENGDGVAERLFTIQQETEERIAALADDEPPSKGIITVFEQPAPGIITPMPRGLQIERNGEVFAFVMAHDEVAALPGASLAVGLAQGKGSWQADEGRLFVPPIAEFTGNTGAGDKPMACSGGEGSTGCHVTCGSGAGCGISCAPDYYSNCCCQVLAPPSCSCIPNP